MKPIEKIKAEIERCYKDYKLSISTEAKYRCEAYKELLNFISSLQAEPVSEDLELASERYACKFSSSKYGHDKIKKAYTAGAQWQEEQMLKDAVEVTVKGSYKFGCYFDENAIVRRAKLQRGAKVKLIIVKED